MQHDVIKAGEGRIKVIIIKVCWGVSAHFLFYPALLGTPSSIETCIPHIIKSQNCDYKGPTDVEVKDPLKFQRLIFSPEVKNTQV